LLPDVERDDPADLGFETDLESGTDDSEAEQTTADGSQQTDGE
jgi:hypothetical protein